MLTPLVPRCYRTSTTCWTENMLTILLQIISMRNVVVTIYAPTGIITYLSKHVIDKIKDTGDITLSLKPAILSVMPFMKASNLMIRCRPATLHQDESLVASFITQYAVTAYASQRHLEKHPITS